MTDLADIDPDLILGLRILERDYGARGVATVVAMLGWTPEPPDNPPSEPVEARTASAGTSGHPDPALAQQERRARYRSALWLNGVLVATVDDMTDAVMRVADAELTDLKAEFERLRVRRGTEAKDPDGFPSWFIGHCPACHSPMSGPCGRCISEYNAERATEHHEAVFDPFQCQTDDDEPCGCRACVVQAERDEARATIARVRVLLDDVGERYVRGRTIRAALDAPTEPAPDLEVSRDAPSPVPPEEPADWDGYGTWLADAGCSTCHQPMTTPGCSTSPESKDRYPHGFHTVSGGCAAQDPPSSLKPDLIDPLPAIKERLDKAMKAQEP